MNRDQFVAYTPTIMFDPVSSVLNKVVSGLGLDRRLREHTFMTLWPTFVSGAIAERSRPLFIDADRNLVVSVADAATGQELSMLKGRIATKFAATARSLNIDVRGLRLDMKHYHQRSTMPEMAEPQPLPKPDASDLEAVVLTDEDVVQVARLKGELEADANADPKLSAKIIGLFERELRLRRWRFQRGFPVCPQCGNPVERLLPPDCNARSAKPLDKPVCMTCLYAD